MVAQVIEVSPCADEADEQRSLDAYLETWPHESFGLPEVQAFKASLLDHCDLLARENGAVLGSGLAALFVGLPESPRVMVTVPPPHRGLGAGTKLYSALSDWARERGLETFEAVLADNDRDSLAFAERRGFTVERHEKGVALDLTAIEPPPVEPPHGVDIVSWADRPELARALFEISVEASPDVPGYEDETHEPFEAWLAHDMQGPGDRPEATFVAVAGDEAVGYAKFSLSSTDPTRAYHDLTAVKRAWRGRGIARALKSAQIGWAKANGFEQLKTTNDERNTAMRRLNEQLGYRPWIGRIFMRGPLA
ncbi:MAG: GNAT family N-acetyltransferase [Actinobacteria bacterium]|nr:MAG: GNAT family N-acetyltransferase [Actinomycetota bacterium]